ncbi:2-methylcitrate dehydratase PrpD [Novosphingobium sp. SG751A]|uniref:MmgE/PrpD family protein n=1 Tax=Novosphingobium sp. SG751A TaxID=2587000 RepID=UPI001554AAA5|nr:MmgE/PrpD family protein [Novosphingobium sp. SG751A]NOW44961.1 2-methylcitrate dehydratase PrpD [Novosphingobium sp. SG751A]
MTTNPLRDIAAFTADFPYDDIPPNVIMKAKIHLLDTLGAALAGTRSPAFALATSAIDDTAGGNAAIWATGRRVAPRDAAFCNGVAAHAYELDDTGGCDHSGAVVVPALMAALASGTASGRDLLSALVVGYEVGRRVLDAAGGYEAHNGYGWHSTGTCGVLASAAAVARLWRLPAGHCEDALSLATSFASGLWAFIHDGSAAKKLHAGRAAEGGLLAARLAKCGMLGPRLVFEDVWGGFFRAFNHAKGDLFRLTDGLGHEWMIERASLKPYASCRGVHSAVDALLDILEESQRSSTAIRTIKVEMPAMLMDMCGGRDVKLLSAAQMSLPGALAMVCAFGEAGLGSYAKDRRTSPRVQAIIDRVILEVDPNLVATDEPVVHVTFQDGTAFSKQVHFATGSKQRPMTSAAVEEKFNKLAGMAVDDATVTQTRQMVLSIEQIEDVSQLTTLLERKVEPACDILD